jgi:hypothetical protein
VHATCPDHLILDFITLAVKCANYEAPYYAVFSTSFYFSLFYFFRRRDQVLDPFSAIIFLKKPGFVFHILKLKGGGNTWSILSRIYVINTTHLGG